MKKLYILMIFTIISTYIFSEPTKYIYPAPESKDDTRFIYEWEILQRALEITKEKYGDYILKPTDVIMNGNRRDYELKSESGRVTVVLGIGTKEREEELHPVRIPLDKGLLGYRVFLINRKNRDKFSNIKNLKLLKKYKAGQGLGWGDIKVWETNGFKVERGSDYEGLFSMLKLGRFDFFPRGILEITDEYEIRKNSIPQIEIEESILIYYPWPRYFFFAKSEDGKKRAARVEEGLNKMIESGEIDAILQKHFAEKLKKLKLKKRKLFILKNPMLSPKTPWNNIKLWYDYNKLISN